MITDDRGPIGLAGVMGGAHTEIADPVTDPSTGEVTGTTEVVVEAAHFDPVTVARAARRHKLSSEASRRFERGVDPLAASAAAQRTVDLLILLAGGSADAGVTEFIGPDAPHTIRISADHPDQVAGVTYGRETVVRRLQEVGCDVYGQDELIVTVPTWRPDLTDPNDLAEEVIRLEGYENLPSTLPRPAAAGSPTASGCTAASAGRSPGPDTSRRSTTPSSGSAPSTSSDSPPTTPTARSSPSSTRCPTRSPRSVRRCCRACSPRCAATTDAAATTSRCSRPGWSSTPAPSSTPRTASRWTTAPPTSRSCR